MGLFFNKKPQEPQEISKCLNVGGSIGEVLSYLKQSFGNYVTATNGNNTLEAEFKIPGQGMIHYYITCNAMGNATQLLLRIVTTGPKVEGAIDDFAKALKRKFSVSY